MVSLSTSLVCCTQNHNMLWYTIYRMHTVHFKQIIRSNFFCKMPPVLVVWKCHMRQTSVVPIYCAIPYIIKQGILLVDNITRYQLYLTETHQKVIQINQPTRCINISSLLLDVYLHLNMFRASSRPSSGAQQLQKQPLVLPLECSGSSAVGRGWAGRPDHDQQHCYHHTPTVKPEAANAVVELLMMGVRTPETCWDVNKCQVINLINWCI